MSADQIIDKIPDVYFDWYARLLPGLVAACLYFYLNEVNLSKLTVSLLIAYLFAAYIAGHIIQPVSSFLVDKIQKLIGTDEEHYTYAKSKPELKFFASKVSKAHSEAVSMFSSSLLVAAVVMISRERIELSSCWEFLILYFLVMAVERCHSRKKKINDIPK